MNNDEKKVLSQFDSWHRTKDIDLEVATPWHSFFISKVGDLSLKGKTVLEIGCGRGGFAFWLSKNYGSAYDKFVAADFSGEAVSMAQNHAKQNSIQNVQFETQDIQQTTFPDQHFDIIISFETIEHVPNPRKAIRELHRILKPNGTLLLTTPNYLGFFGLYRIYLRLTGRRWKEAGQPINQFVTIPKTNYWLRSSGFEVKYFDSEDISIPWPGKRKVLRFNWNSPKWLMKYLGLQSFFICSRK
ncbi:MAG: class I SAM-dependent methyltransferase [Cyanothece sp. SIO1E1]|nr:class I SAM-dependent methyltransferase [Cyanothece sp. SIO1E1]